MVSLKDSFDNLFCFSQEQFHSLKAEGLSTVTEKAMLDLFGFFAANQGYARLLHKWKEVIGHREVSLAVLDAHGYVDLPGWQYQDEGKAIPVQEWIDQHDGKATALAIYACNGNNAEITAQKSLVLHSDRSVSVNDVIQRRVVARVFVPNIGYIGKKAHDIERVIRGLPTICSNSLQIPQQYPKGE